VITQFPETEINGENLAKNLQNTAVLVCENGSRTRIPYCTVCRYVEIEVLGEHSGSG
jgi:hypothetical protein